MCSEDQEEHREDKMEMTVCCLQENGERKEEEQEYLHNNQPEEQIDATIIMVLGTEESPSS